MVNRSCRIAFNKYVKRQNRIDRGRRESIKKGYENNEEEDGKKE